MDRCWCGGDSGLDKDLLMYICTIVYRSIDPFSSVFYLAIGGSFLSS